MLYKVLDFDGTAFHKRWATHPDYIWSLPTSKNPGRWSPVVEGPLELGVNGITLVHPKSVLTWLGPAVFEAQYVGEKLPRGDWIMCRRVRLLKKTPWSYDKGAEWIDKRFREVLKHCFTPRLADTTRSFYEAFIDLEEAAMTRGNIHEIRGWRQGELSFYEMLDKLEPEIKSEVGKAPFEAFSHAALAVRFLRHDRKARNVEGTIVALGKCLPGTRQAFMRDVLGWENQSPEDLEVIEKSKTDPKGDFTPIPKSAGIRGLGT